MARSEDTRKGFSSVSLGKETSFNGVLRFSERLVVQGKFKGTIEATGKKPGEITGELVVEKDALVDADYITINSLKVYGTVIGDIHATDKVEMMSGAKVQGDVTATRLRIADGVLFEGKCTMTTVDKEVEIFSRPAEEIKAELLNG
jgi:cytoskeletal protein CcmA (bactofilin family)